MPKADFDSDLVRTLAGLLDETGLTEIEYNSGDWSIRVARQAMAQSAVVTTAPTRATGAEGERAAGDNGAAAIDATTPGAVTSPMVGTVYLAPDPESANYVSVGDQVSEGQTVLLVEAMKTFNEIRAPRAGVVQSVLVENMMPVEYGDVLMVIQ